VANLPKWQDGAREQEIPFIIIVHAYSPIRLWKAAMTAMKYAFVDKSGALSDRIAHEQSITPTVFKR
jgi:hypothetical protein